MFRSPTVRALALVPLLAVGVDQTRAVVLCGSDAHSCLEAAGRGWIGFWGVALIALYAVALGLIVARAAPAAPRPRFARSWAIGTAGVLTACLGQAGIAAALGGAPLGGGWLGLLVLCALAGALIAVALRVAPEHPWRAPRAGTLLHPLWLAPAPRDLPRGLTSPRRPRGRAPPTTA